MPRYRLNRHIASVFIAVAAGMGVVGTIGYGGYHLLTAPDSPETAEARRQSAILRNEIITYLPLAREMTVAAPAYEYPDSSQGSMNRTFAVGDEIIDNDTGIGNIEARCEVLTYLRAVHRRAAENYLASNPALPLPNLQTHLDAARRPALDVPLCQNK
jgi:hypothetical protein